MIYLWIVISVVVYGAATEWVRRTAVPGHLVAFVLIPAVLLVYWLSQGAASAGYLLLLKVPSVCFGALWIMALRYKNWVKAHWARVVAYFVLFINILEAAAFELYDVLASGPELSFGGSYVNAAAGAVLLLTLAYPRFVFVKEDDPQRNLRYDVGMLWVIVYTLWNFTFVYGTNAPGDAAGDYGATAIIHLGIPLLLMRGRAENYVQVRAYSLSFCVVIFLIFPYEPFTFKTPYWYNAEVATLLQVVSFCGAAALIFRSVLAMKRRDAPRNMLQSLWQMVRRPSHSNSAQ